MKNYLYVTVVALSLVSCTTVSPQQQFSTGCAQAGEAMANVVAARRAGKIDDVTYNKIDDAYDAAVATCENPPLSDDGFEIASTKLIEFASHANSVAGVQDYGGY